MSIDHRGPRIVLALGLLAGVGQALTLSRLQPDQVTLATDVYYRAAEAALAGGEPYSVSPPGLAGYHFLYPPVVLGAMLPYGRLDPGSVYVVQTTMNLLATAAVAVVLVRTVERGGIDLGRADKVLIAAFAFGSTGAVTNLLNGQVNPQLALGIAGGVVLVDRGRETIGGVVLAAVATVKLFPALVGAWLLRVRAWRAVAAATATGMGLFALGLFAFGPDLTAAWIADALGSESSVAAFENGPNPASNKVTIRRQIAYLAPWVPTDLLIPAGAAILAPVVLAAYRTVETLRDRLVALQVTLLAMLILMPLEPFYFSLAVFPGVALLYLIEGRWPRRLYVVGFLLAAVPLTMDSIDVWVETLSLSGAVAETITSIAQTGFSFALPPMYGIWLMFGACILFQHRRVAGTLDGGPRDQ
ncbi:MAG: glycosyltransferase family 87 protein [Halobacteriales archaeon]